MKVLSVILYIISGINALIALYWCILLLFSPYLFDDPNGYDTAFKIVGGLIAALVITIFITVFSWNVFKKGKYILSLLIGSIPVLFITLLVISSSLMVKSWQDTPKVYRHHSLQPGLFPDFSVKHKPDWGTSVEKTTSKGVIVGFLKDGYKITIKQVLITGGGYCLFKDSPPETTGLPALDFREVEYTQIDTPFGKTRIAANEDNEDPLKKTFTVCTAIEDEPTVFRSPKYGHTTLKIPSDYNEQIYQEAIDIIRNITPTN